MPSSSVHHVSLSHTRTGAAVAIGTGPVGIDVESIHRRTHWQRIAAHCFGAHEQHWLAQQPGELAKTAFLKLWTCKEAWLKAQGLGLSQLEQAIFTPQDHGPWRPPGENWRAQTRLYGDLVISLLWQGSGTPYWQQARLDGTGLTATPSGEKSNWC